MKPENKMILIRVLCWIVLVIAPTAAVWWLVGLRNVGILAVAIPFILIAERVFRWLLRKPDVPGTPGNGMKSGSVQPGGAANGSHPVVH